MILRYLNYSISALFINIYVCVVFWLCIELPTTIVTMVKTWLPSCWFPCQSTATRPCRSAPASACPATRPHPSTSSTLGDCMTKPSTIAPIGAWKYNFPTFIKLWQTHRPTNWPTDQPTNRPTTPDRLASSFNKFTILK